jgi:hypothetical protein
MLVFCDGCVNHGFHFGCNSWFSLEEDCFAMAKDGLFFKATELNKNQVPAKALWVQCIWACALYFGKFGDLLTYATFASLLYPNYFGCILRKKNLMRIGLTKLLVIHLYLHFIL